MREDWSECLLGEISSKITKGSTPTTYGYKYQKEGINFIKIENVIRGRIDKKSIYQFISEEAHESQKRSQLEEGDVLFSIAGTIGETCLITKDVLPANTNQAFAIISGFNKVLDANFLRKQLDSFISRKLKDKARGGAMNNVSLTDLKDLNLVIPPLVEQNRIVSKIDALFSSLDQGIADLKKAQDQLKVYRQAVLKKAFEGELTKAWREQQTDLPTADELLEQIKEERQKHYEIQLKEWKEAVIAWEKNGKGGKKSNKPQNIKEFKPLSNEDLNVLPKIPNGWAWQKFGNVCLKIMDGTHFSPKNISVGDYKYISAKNIKEGRIDLTKISYVSKKDHQEIFSRCDVKKGDVLYIKDGATTGRAAVNNLDEEFSLLSSVGVFRTSQNLIIPKFLEYYLNAQITRNRMLSNIAGVAITRLTLVKLNNSIFLICSPREQKQIIREIESRLSVCDKVEQSIIESLEKASALRQSILKKAFDGSLLSVDEIAACKLEPDWEPADVLLERIKKEKK